MDQSGILRISETAEGEVDATAAKLHLSITGHNFVYGNAAREKCDEVRALVAALKATGVEAEDIQVMGVRVKQESGIFSKTSSGVYDIAVVVEDVSRLGDILGVVTSAKNISLEKLEWRFDDESTRVELLQQAMRRAASKAEKLMGCVGHRVVGIKACSDSIVMPLDKVAVELSQPGSIGAGAPGGVRRRAAAPVDIGTEFRGRKEISATVTVDFIVARETA